jgi:uncharacterized membrane protein YgaE (UPF0421/DUF939 family)
LWSIDLVRLKGIQLAVRAGLGASLSLAIAQLLHFDRPLFACVAALIVTDLTPAKTRALGLRRLGATLVGAATGASLSLVLPPVPWTIGLSVLVAILISEVLRAREGAKVAAFVCALIVLDHSAEPWRFALDRLMETILGVAVAWLISYVPKLIRIEEPGAERADPPPAESGPKERTREEEARAGR